MNDLNKNTWPVFLEFHANAHLLNCEASEAPCGVKIIDAGVRVRGGFSAGERMIELSAAGLATASIQLLDVGGKPWPHVEIQSDHAFLGCFVCQSGSRVISVEEPKMIVSGPACVLADRERYKEEFDLVDASDCAVMILERSFLPDNAVCKTLAERCGVHSSRLGIIVAPTTSLAGAAQVAGRSIEVALQKLYFLGVDIRKLSSALGRCPVAIPFRDEKTAIGKVNDVMGCASQVWLTAAGLEQDVFHSILSQVPACAHPYYGRSFAEIAAEAGRFFGVDKGFFSPGEITIVDLETGLSGHAGRRDETLLKLFLEAS